MTARKNQAQPIILKAVLFIGPFRRTPLRFEISHELVLRRIKSCSSTQSINGFESGRRNQPGPRVAGYSTARPQAQRSRKGLVHRLLGQIKITEQANQSCEDSSRIHTIKGVEQFAYLLMLLLGGTLGDDTLGHDYDLSKPATPNQFGKRKGHLSIADTSPFGGLRRRGLHRTLKPPCGSGFEPGVRRMECNQELEGSAKE